MRCRLWDTASEVVLGAVAGIYSEMPSDDEGEWMHFYNALLPNGYFFLGHSESLFGINEKFRLVHFPGATAYWKPTEAATKAGPQ